MAGDSSRGSPARRTAARAVRQIAGGPFSACVIANAICSTLNRFRFIFGLPNRGRNHPTNLSLTPDRFRGQDQETIGVGTIDARWPQGAAGTTGFSHFAPAIAGRTFQSRLFVGTGKYKTYDLMRDSLARAGARW
jgi:hypothetical protein